MAKAGFVLALRRRGGGGGGRGAKKTTKQEHVHVVNSKQIYMYKGDKGSIYKPTFKIANKMKRHMLCNQWSQYKIIYSKESKTTLYS